MLRTGFLAGVGFRRGQRDVCECRAGLGDVVGVVATAVVAAATVVVAAIVAAAVIVGSRENRRSRRTRYCLNLQGI